MTEPRPESFQREADPDLAAAPDLWLTETFKGATSHGLRIKSVLHQEQSPFQHVAVYDTWLHGRVLALDGFIMTTERDEFIYHEMIAHPPMQTLDQPRRAAVIGGGDGGTVRELTRYPDLDEILLVEIDRAVVEAARRHLPTLAAGLEDKRVQCRFTDGARFIAEAKPDSLDLIVVDATDPIGPGEVLFSEEFYQNCARALAPPGVLTAQTESPIYHPQTITRIYNRLAAAFPKTNMYWAVTPSYPGALWTFAYASKERHPLRHHAPQPGPLSRCRYYTPDLHGAAFALPAFARDLLPDGHPQR